MKKTIIAAMCVLGTALLSCDPVTVEQDPILDYASGQETEITVAPGGGEISLEFVSTEAWSVQTVENWFEFTRLSGKGGNNKLKVKVDPNISHPRTGVIRIEAGENTLPFTITQDVSDHVSAFEKEFEIDANGGSVTLSFTTTNVWTATTEAEWLTLSATEGEPGRTSVTATAGQNIEEAHTATVIVTCGEEKMEFTIFQDVCPPVLLTYEDWLGVWESVGADNNTISYTVKQKTPGQSYTVTGFGATVEALFDAGTGNLLLPFQDAGGNSSYTFYLAGIDTNNYVAYGDNDEEILAIVTSKDGNTARASGNEYDYTYSDGSTDHVLVSRIGLMGYGTRSDGSTGWVTFSDVDYLYLPADWTKTGDVGGEEPPVGNYDYTDWLGEWSVTRQKCAYNSATGKWEYQADVTDTWTISQNVSGVSYTITGMNGEEFPVEALYTSDGFLSIENGQEVGSAMFQGFDHAFNVSLLGTYLNDEDGGAYRISGTFEICHATLTSATEANLVPNTINVGSLGNIALSAPRFYATDPATNTVYQFDSYIMTIVPTKMTKIGGGTTGGADLVTGTYHIYDLVQFQSGPEEMESDFTVIADPDYNDGIHFLVDGIFGISSCDWKAVYSASAGTLTLDGLMKGYEEDGSYFAWPIANAGSYYAGVFSYADYNAYLSGDGTDPCVLTVDTKTGELNGLATWLELAAMDKSSYEYLGTFELYTDESTITFLSSTVQTSAKVAPLNAGYTQRATLKTTAKGVRQYKADRHSFRGVVDAGFVAEGKAISSANCIVKHGVAEKVSKAR